MTTIALFGAGFIGRVHAASVVGHPSAALRWVCDVDRAAAERLAGSAGATATTEADEIWKDDDVDAVIIASSTDTHAELLSAAARAGRAVYCEKPIDLDIDRVRSVAAEVVGSEVPVFVGFTRRYDANHRALWAAVRRGDVGDVELMHLLTRGPEPPPISYIRRSGGQFRDQTIHMFDLACWIAGAAPVEVYATGAALTDPAIADAGDIDTSIVVLTMPDGALCQIDSMRRCAYGYDERIEVVGAGGMIESGRKPVREVTRWAGDRIVADGLHPGWFERIEPTFATAFDAFIGVVEGRVDDYPSLTDGVRAQMIAEAAMTSLRDHRPVDIAS
jgi:myo-inositol 2-dehydrogenase/D-chiro-inositol 1-dehydrogenase